MVGITASATSAKRAPPSLFDDEHGQATVEYILIVSLAVIVATSLVRNVLRAIDRGILRLGGQLEKDLKTGRMAVGNWKN